MTTRDWRGNELTLVSPAVLDAAKERYGRLAPIASLLPFKLAGGFSVEKLDVECDRCGSHCTYTRGAITRPTASVAAFEMMGHCVSCKMLTPATMRMTQAVRGGDVQVTWLQKGRWRSADARELSPGAFDEFARALRRWFWRARRGL